jgi:NADPH-ferrihemoprotein reductase
MDLAGDERGSTLEATFDLEGTGLTYKTATNLAIFPENTQDDVQEVARLLSFDLSQRFIFKQSASAKRQTKHPFPGPCTVREALTRYVDLRGQLRKKLISDLSQHVKNDAAKAKLLELTANKEMWSSQVEQPMLGLLDLVRSYHRDLDLPLAAFLQITDRLMVSFLTLF